jgi:hypothetical protein
VNAVMLLFNLKDDLVVVRGKAPANFEGELSFVVVQLNTLADFEGK